MRPSFKLKKEEITITSGVVKSTVWYIPKKKQYIGKNRNSKSPGRAQKTTKVNFGRILSFVKKNLFTTFQPTSKRAFSVLE